MQDKNETLLKLKYITPIVQYIHKQQVTAIVYISYLSYFFHMCGYNDKVTMGKSDHDVSIPIPTEVIKG